MLLKCKSDHIKPFLFSLKRGTATTHKWKLLLTFWHTSFWIPYTVFEVPAESGLCCPTLNFDHLASTIVVSQSPQTQFCLKAFVIPVPSAWNAMFFPHIFLFFLLPFLLLLCSPQPSLPLSLSHWSLYSKCSLFREAFSEPLLKIVPLFFSFPLFCFILFMVFITMSWICFYAPLSVSTL